MQHVHDFSIYRTPYHPATPYEKDINLSGLYKPYFYPVMGICGKSLNFFLPDLWGCEYSICVGPQTILWYFQIVMFTCSIPCNYGIFTYKKP